MLLRHFENKYRKVSYELSFSPAIATICLWQEGYGAFSYSKSHLDNVIKYITKQPEHHKKKSFKEEYLDFLQ
jgi:predicted restriction endonuclease